MNDDATLWTVRQSVLIFGWAATAVTLLAIIFLFNQPAAVLTTQDAFGHCLDDTGRALAVQKADVRTYITAWNLCDRQLYDNLARDDFAIRREKFKRQELDERVNMWLVVVITLSGVVLSAMQLVMSFRIAVAGKEQWSNDTQLAVEQGKMSFKSSVTGLAILALSLAFFAVYVRYIYGQQDSGPPLYPPSMFPVGYQLPEGSFAPPKTSGDSGSSSKGSK